MATNHYPDTPSPTPFSKEQRQRLEAVQFAKRIVGRNDYQSETPEAQNQRVRTMIELADYIATGAF